MQKTITNAIIFVLLCAAACTSGSTQQEDRQKTAPSAVRTGHSQADIEKYKAAKERARQWLDGLVVDPLQLRALGFKGKKILGEILEAYVRLQAFAPPAEKPALIKRLQGLTAITCELRYHDMLSIGDLEFKQDATSYLRVAYLMERAGLDTALYRQEIKKIEGRLNGHMRQRGPNQQMVFSWYYEHFGLKEPFALAEGYKKGVIAARLKPEQFPSTMAVYDLTHEIFVPYRFGEKLDAQFFSAEEKAYLRPTLEALTAKYMAANNVDIVSELVECMRYLGFYDSPVYARAIRYIFELQEPDGRWGRYELAATKNKEFVNPGFYLHTTMVALKALIAEFEIP